MSVLFWDVKQNKHLKQKLEESRIPGANFEVLYADDTIIISRDTRIINEFLKEIRTGRKRRITAKQEENRNGNLGKK